LFQTDVTQKGGIRRESRTGKKKEKGLASCLLD